MPRFGQAADAYRPGDGTTPRPPHTLSTAKFRSPLVAS